MTPLACLMTPFVWLDVIIIIAIVIAAFFVLTFIVYMLNLDMKMMTLLEPMMLKHYDKIDRDQHL